MLMTAVTGIDYRNPAVAGGTQRGAFLGMAHGGDVGIAADDADGVRNGLAFGSAGDARVGEAQHLPAEIQHGRFKGKAGAGARLVEQSGQPFAGGHVLVGGRIIVDTVGQIHQAKGFIQRKVRRVDQMSHTHSPLTNSLFIFIRHGLRGAGRKTL